MLNTVIEQLMSEVRKEYSGENILIIIPKYQVAPFPGYPEETPRFAPLKSPPGLECTEEACLIEQVPK